MLWALGLPLDALETPRRQRDATAAHRQGEALVARRIETRQPAAYLTGEAWLQNVPFTIDERGHRAALATSPSCWPTAKTGTLDAWLSDRTRRVLDLCTGNGSLAVIAAMAYPEIDGRCRRHLRRRAGASPASTSTATASTTRITLHRVRPVRRLARPLRPDPLQPALRQRGKHARAAGRVPGRAGAGAGRRRRRHGPDPAHRCRAPEHLTTTACWCSRSATSAPTSRRPFRASRSPG